MSPTPRVSRPSALVRRCAPAYLLACVCACAASDEDCERLGDKFVELYMAGQTEESRKLGPEVLANAAEAGRAEIVEQCKAKSTPKASVERCLAATTMDEFLAC